MKQCLNLIILFVLCTGCYRSPPAVSGRWQEINGRDSADERLIIRRPVYRMKVPEHWSRIVPPPESSIVDTTLPIAEFWIENQIHITIHNFPFQDPERRIPPRAQVARWQRQLSNLTEKEAVIEPVSYSGYVGLYFEGSTDEKQVMAWSLQLDDEHVRSLSRQIDASSRSYIEQMQADVTIKVAGPPHLLNQHRGDIIAGAKSFELIQEIPRMP